MHNRDLFLVSAQSGNLNKGARMPQWGETNGQLLMILTNGAKTSFMMPSEPGQIAFADRTCMAQSKVFSCVQWLGDCRSCDFVIISSRYLKYNLTHIGGRF